MAAGDLDVNLMGGGVLTAALAAGLVDEIIVYQVPAPVDGSSRNCPPARGSVWSRPYRRVG
jgi:riboflavin biosynthesis pyrimidine reductase